MFFNLVLGGLDLPTCDAYELPINRSRGRSVQNSLFKKNSYDLTLKEASYIAVTLPNPKKRNAKKLSINLKKRAESVRNGANTLRLDGRASCVL